MLAHPGFDFAVDLPAVERDDAESLAATVGACHAMFGTKSFDGKRGLTDIEAVELVTRFLYYMHDLKKNSDLMRTLPQSSESKPPGTSETTSNTSESSSTATESKPDDPTQS